jgi:hypothetical protein
MWRKKKIPGFVEDKFYHPTGSIVRFHDGSGSSGWRIWSSDWYLLLIWTPQ